MKASKLIAVLFGVSLLAHLAIGQTGTIVLAGSKAEPMPVAHGEVQRVTEKGPPLKLEATKIQVKCSDIYYRAVAKSGGLHEPVSGEVQTVIIGDFKVQLASKDFSKGFLDTKDFGKIALFIMLNMGPGPDRLILAVTDEQLKKIHEKVKKNAAE